MSLGVANETDRQESNPLSVIIFSLFVGVGVSIVLFIFNELRGTRAGLFQFAGVGGILEFATANRLFLSSAFDSFKRYSGIGGFFSNFARSA